METVFSTRETGMKLRQRKKIEGESMKKSENEITYRKKKAE